MRSRPAGGSTQADDARRIEAGGVGWRQVFSDQDDRGVEAFRFFFQRVGQQAKHAAADVLQIGGAFLQAGVIQRADFLRPFVDALPPCPAGAVAGIDLALRGVDQIRVVEEFFMRAEDRRAGRAAACLHFIVQLAQLQLGGGNRLLQAGGFRLRIVGGDGDDDLLAAEVAQRADGQTGRGGNAGNDTRLQLQVRAGAGSGRFFLIFQAFEYRR